METAREIFKKGDRVKHSKEGLKTLAPKHPNRYGTVTGFSPNDVNCVRVHWDGLVETTQDPYHIDFIERLVGQTVVNKIDLIIGEMNGHIDLDFKEWLREQLEELKELIS